MLKDMSDFNDSKKPAGSIEEWADYLDDETAYIPPEERSFHVLLVVSKIQKYGFAKNFLQRKNWTVTFVEGMNEAIQYMLKKTPEFVFISMSIKSSKIDHLPQILQETFKTQCVVFGEDYQRYTVQRLNKANNVHIMRERISGPSVFRKVVTIVKEQEKMVNLG